MNPIQANKPVLVTGATGVLGQPTVRLLVKAGFAVRAVARGEAKASRLRELGAEPISLDLFDPAAVREAARGVGAILHLATRIPAHVRSLDAWLENDRLRREGTANLAAAAIAEGADLIYPSVTLIYPDSGAAWLDATTAAPADPLPVVLRSTLDAEAQVARVAAAGPRGVVVRLAAFYGPTSGQSQQMLDFARKGLASVPGRPEAFMSSIWVDDAASAVVAALQKAPSGTFDVTDDEPLTRRDLAGAMAHAVGRRSLMNLPGFTLRAALGPVLLQVLSPSQRVSNARFKAATGWTPAVPSAREGWMRLAAAGGGAASATGKREPQSAD